MVDSIAVQMATAAKAKRAIASASEKTRVEALINQLATYAWVEANAGRSYLQLVQSNATHKDFYEAITTKIGIVYLANLGFRVEQMNGVANIWWEAADTIQKEADAILHPPAAVTPPVNNGPVTTPVTPV